MTHRNWYHKKSGQGRTRREIKTMIRDLVTSVDASTSEFINPSVYLDRLGMIKALKWVINWCELDDNYNETRATGDVE